MTPAGFPHSDIPGSTRICRYPRLFAAYHVLHRLLVPRHPPCALSSLTGHPFGACSLVTRFSYSVVNDLARTARSGSSSRARGAMIERCLVGPVGSPAGAEARGSLEARSLLVAAMVEIAGVEPATSGLQSRRSAS